MIEKTTTTLTKDEYREKIQSFENTLMECEGARFGNDACPLKHTFIDGIYTREIFMEKGLFVSSRIHKTNHPYFILQGDVSVITEEGVVRLQAPHCGITKSGTKRGLYIHEDTIWVTVHATNKTSVEEVEKDLVADSFYELDHEESKVLK